MYEQLQEYVSACMYVCVVNSQGSFVDIDKSHGIVPIYRLLRPPVTELIRQGFLRPTWVAPRLSVSL